MCGVCFVEKSLPIHAFPLCSWKKFLRDTLFELVSDTHEILLFRCDFYMLFMPTVPWPLEKSKSGALCKKVKYVFGEKPSRLLHVGSFFNADDAPLTIHCDVIEVSFHTARF